MSDLPKLDDDLRFLPPELDLTWNRAEGGESGPWRFDAVTIRSGAPDKSGVLVELAGFAGDAKAAAPFYVDHGIKGDATRYGWAHYRMDDERGWFEGTMPDTAQTRDFIARIEHDRAYNKAFSSAGLLYARSELRRPSKEQRAAGVRVVMPRYAIRDVSYTNRPRLASATFELLRSFDEDVVESDTAEEAIRMAERDGYEMSEELRAVIERRTKEGTL